MSLPSLSEQFRGRWIASSIQPDLLESLSCRATSRRLQEGNQVPRTPEEARKLWSLLESELERAHRSLGDLLSATSLAASPQDEVLNGIADEPLDPQRFSALEAGHVLERLLRHAALEDVPGAPVEPPRLPASFMKELARIAMHPRLLPRFRLRLAPLVCTGFAVRGFWQRWFAGPCSVFAPLTGFTVPLATPGIAILYRLAHGPHPWRRLVHEILSRDPGLTEAELLLSARLLEETGVIEVELPPPDPRVWDSLLLDEDPPAVQSLRAGIRKLLEPAPAPAPCTPPLRETMPLPSAGQIEAAHRHRLLHRRHWAGELERRGFFPALMHDLERLLQLPAGCARVTLRDLVRGLRLLLRNERLSLPSPASGSELIPGLDEPLAARTVASLPPRPSSARSRLRLRRDRSGEACWALEEMAAPAGHGEHWLVLEQGALWEQDERARRNALRRVPWLVDFWIACSASHPRWLDEIRVQDMLLRPATVLLPAGSPRWQPPDAERADSLSIMSYGRRVSEAIGLGERLRFESIVPHEDLSADLCFADLQNPWSLRRLLRWLEEHRSLCLRVTAVPLHQAFLLE